MGHMCTSKVPGCHRMTWWWHWWNERMSGSVKLIFELQLAVCDCMLWLFRVSIKRFVNCQVRAVRVLASRCQSILSSNTVAVDWGPQQHLTSICTGSMTGGIARRPLLIEVVKMSLAVAPHTFTKQGFFLVKRNGLCGRCSKLVALVKCVVESSLVPSISPALV